LTSTATVSSSAEHPAAGRLLAGARLGALLTSGLIWGGGWVIGSILLWPARRQVRRWIFGSWARIVTRVLGVRIRAEGAAPPRPFFLVSNHLSYLDVVVYAALGPARFVAKREVRDWPGVGFLAWAMATIFVDRRSGRDARRALDALAGAVAEGDGVILFAEATSTAGREVRPFRPALLEWAAQAAYPVHFASLSYRTPPHGPGADQAVCWWGDMTFGPHLLELCRLPWIEATVRFGGEPIEDTDRKRLAERLHRAVSAHLIPVAMER